METDFKQYIIVDFLILSKTAEVMDRHGLTSRQTFEVINTYLFESDLADSYDKSKLVSKGRLDYARKRTRDGKVRDLNGKIVKGKLILLKGTLHEI